MQHNYIFFFVSSNSIQTERCGSRSNTFIVPPTVCTERLERYCKITKVKGLASVQTLREQSFQVSGPRLFNYFPKLIRNIKICDLVFFNKELDAFLNQVPDESKTRILNPGATNSLTGKRTNSIIYQVARKRDTSANIVL